MAAERKQSLLNGAVVLVIATTLVKIIGAIYKIPLTGIIGAEGRGYFASAYNIYTPIYAISMAGLPVAVSRLVSKNYALGRYRDVKQVFRVTLPAYFLLGVLGTVFLLLISYPYTSMDWALSINSPKTLISLIMIAPSILFCCVVSTYRGYYAGLNNMVPTAVTEVLEAAGKLVFGLSLAVLVERTGLMQYAQSGVVFGVKAESNAQAASIIYPYAAAAAILGVTLGTVISMIYAALRHRLKGDGITEQMLINSPKPLGNKYIAKELFAIAFPSAVSALVLNITNLIDAWMVQNILNGVVGNHLSVIKGMYGKSLMMGGVLDENIKSYLYGAFDTAMDFRNLIPTITMTLGISAIPIMSAAWAKKNTLGVQNAVSTVIRIVSLIAFPAGMGFLVLSEPILGLMYRGTNSASSIPITANVLASYGLMMIFLTLSAPTTNMLQAIGKASVPAKVMAASCVVKIVCNFIFIPIPKLNIYGALIGTAIFYVMNTVINLFVLMKNTGIKIKYSSVFIKPLLASIASGAAAYASYGFLERVLVFGDANSRLNGASLACVLSIGVAAVIYLICVLLMRILEKDDILILPKGENIAKVLEKFRLLG
ncbi:MAG TPA: polysaccharide biosynthesis protein [Oscillospiraceae bacterium]|nr:polysaccharide biosynthesis protein [Oscillospiraceae bacterium]